MWAKLGPAVGWQDWQVDWLRDGTGDYGPVNQTFAAFEAEIREECAKVLDQLAANARRIAATRHEEAAEKREVDHALVAELSYEAGATAIRALSRTSEEEDRG